MNKIAEDARTSRPGATHDIDRLRRDVSLSSTVEHYGYKLERNGHEFETCCPFHAEDTPSFTIFVGQDGVERFQCFGCGEKGDVLDFVQKVKGVNLPEAIRILDGRDNTRPNVQPRKIQARNAYESITAITPPVDPLQPGSRVRLYNPKRKGERSEWGSFAPSMVFPYRHIDGSLFGYVLRHDLPDGGKETPMVMFTCLPDGTETWCRFPFPKPRPLYGLHELGDRQVLVVEGEKCRDKLRRATGRAVVSWAGGTQGVKHTDWSPLAGRDVIIWPDFDAPGMATALEIAVRLNEIGAKVRFVGLTQIDAASDIEQYTFDDWQAGALPSRGWDSADAADAGWTKPQLDDFMRMTMRQFPVTEMAYDIVKKAQLEREALTGEPSFPDPDPAPIAEQSMPAPRASSYWGDLFVTNSAGRILPGVTRNWTLLLENHDDTRDMLALDEFSGETMLFVRPPWERLTSCDWRPRPIKNADLAEAVEWLESLGMTPKISNISPVLDKIAARNRYHPVRDYFRSLPAWDGVNRIDSFVSHYLGAEDSDLNRAFGRKWLCAVAKRVFQPGCKFDHVLVLQGAQGIGKSAFGRALVPIHEWVSESVNVGDKAREVIENTRGILIVELAELAGKSNKEVEAIKKFITTTEDKARGAYQHKVEAVSRQFVFYATTNQDEFLTDTTGNRRWWPVVPGHIDLAAIRSDRDQLWAEVLTAYQSEALWIDDAQLQIELDALNRGKTDFGPTYEIIRDLIPAGAMLLPPEEARRLLTGGSDDPSRLPAGWRANLLKALTGLGFHPGTSVFSRRGNTTRAYVRGEKDTALWARYSNGRIEFEHGRSQWDDQF